MPTFLENISIYNPKASAAISEAVKEGQVEKANMMSALKTAANDGSLSTDVRLNALTALINLGGLLEVPLPPYFPVSTTYANEQTYVGLHNDLTGLQGGLPGEYLHLTQAEKDSIASKASLSDITFQNLLGMPGDNYNLASALNLKQDALSGNGLVRVSGGTITYDSGNYLQTISNIAAGGDLNGFYPNPTIKNGSVINQALTGFNGSGTWSAITPSDTIITAIQKINAYVVAASASVGAVNNVALTLPDTVFTYTNTPATGSVMLSGSFINQAQNKFFAGPSAGGAGLPTFRFLTAQDLPTTGIGAGTVGAASQIPVITYDNYGRITNITTTSATNGGIVNTVGFTVPAGIFDKTITGTAADPVLNLQILPQDPNKVWAGPESGVSTGNPTFRALVPADIPNNIPQTKIAGLDASLNSKLGLSLNTSLIYMGNGSGSAVNTKIAGDLTAEFSTPNGVNTATFTIANKAITYAKFADIPDSPANATRPILLGRFAAGQGPMQQLTLDPTAFNYNSTSGQIGLITPNPPALTTAGDLLTSSGANQLERLPLPGDYATKGYLLVPYVGTTAPDIKLMWGEAKGDITYSIDTTTTPGTPFPNFVIGANKVTLSKIQTIATNTILGNNAVGAAIPAELTPANVVAMLPLQDATTGTTKGVVPASNFTPASGKTKADYFLNANNGWTAVSGLGTVTSVSVVTAKGFAGTVADDTTAAKITIKLNSLTGILKGTGDTIGVAAVGTEYVGPGAITTSGLTIGQNKLAGRTIASPADIQEIDVNGTLSLASATLGINLGSQNTWSALQTFSSGIRMSGTSGYVQFVAQTNGASQTYTLPAAYPGSGTTGYLKSTDAGLLTWDTATGTTAASVTFDAVAGNTAPKVFNGSQAMTIGYATVGAQQANANLTGVSALTYASGTPFVKMTAAGTFALDNNTYMAGTATQYAVLVGGASNTVASVTGGSAGQVLRYVSGANPAWSTAVYPNTTAQNRILYSSADNVISEIAAPADGTFLKFTTALGYSWSTAVASLGFGTQGLLSNSGTATAPVISVTGNSGGVVYFNSSSTWASSGTLEQYELMIGGGAGNPPTTINNGANGTLLISNGLTNAPSFTTATYPSTTSANRILFSSANDVIDQIVAPGTADRFLKWDGSSFTWATASGGGGTVSSASAGQIAVYTGSGPSTTVGGLTSTSGIIYTDGSAVAQSLSYAGSNNLYLKVNSAGTGLIWDVAGTGSGTVNPGAQYALAYYINASGGTVVDDVPISTTNGTNFLTQVITGGVATSFPTWTGSTGTGSVVLATSPTIISPYIGDTATTGHIHFRKAGASIPSGFANTATMWFPETGTNKKMAIMWDNVGYASEFQLNATATQTYIFPNASGTVALIDSTQNLTIPTAGGNSGEITLGVSGGGTVSLVAPASITTGQDVYILPIAYPGAATNYFLTSNLSGQLAWQQITGGGDVSSDITSSTAGNFAIFSDVSGKLISQSSVATLGAGPFGRATFNNGVDVGVSGTTTGTLVFRNSSTSATTTLQASTSQTANLIYTLPASAPAAGNVLSSDGNGNLSWTTAGAGNMVLATAGQIVTGSKIYSDTTLLLRNPLQTFSTTLSAGASTANWTATFPNASGTVPLLSLAQTFTAAQTFQANVTLGTGSYNSTLLDFTGTTSNRINFNQTIASGPATNLTPSVGTRIVIANTGNASGSANSIGFNTGEMWLNHDISGAISFYNNTTRFMRFTGGYLEMLGSAGSFRMEGTTSNMIRFNANGSSAPGYSSSGDFAGTKIIFLPQLGSGINSYAMGVNATDLWTAGAASYTWYGSTSASYMQLISTGVSLGHGAATAGFMTLASAIPTILFNSQASNIPSTSSRSTGTRIVINPTFSAGVSTDSAIGVSGSGAGGAGNWQMWFSTPGTMAFYAGNTTATPSIQISTNGILCNNGFSATTSQITFGAGLTAGWALMGATATSSWAAPSTTTRVDGTRIVLYPVASATNNNYDAGIGITGGVAGGLQNINTYISSPGDVRFYCYGAATPALRIGASILLLADSVNFQFDTNNGTKFGTGTGQKIGFFNATPVAQQTGGALTAAATYGTNEQTMLNRAFTALRNLGLIS